MQWNTHGIQDRERCGDGNRDCRGGNHGDADWQQNYGDENYRADGEQEFTLEIPNPIVHYGWLIGDQIELQIGWKERPDSRERLIDLFAKLDNITTFLHFHGKQNARPAIESGDLIGVLVTAFDAREISDVNGLARVLGDVHQNPLDLVFGEQQTVGLDRNVLAKYQKVAGILYDVALLKGLNDLIGVRKVL